MGGAALTLGDIFRSITDSKDIVGVVLAVAKYLGALLKKRITTYVESTRPRFTIDLALRTTKDVAEPRHVWLPGRLTNLAHLSEEVRKELAQRYPMLLFDRSLRASICSRSFRVKYRITHERNNLLNKGRLLSQIKGLKFRDGYSISIDFDRLFAIKRLESPTKCDGSFWYSEKEQKYFTFISTNVVRFK